MKLTTNHIQIKAQQWLELDSLKERAPVKPTLCKKKW